MPKRRDPYAERWGFDKETHRAILYKRQHGKCPECDEPLGKRYATSKHVNLDHRIPQSHGGGDDLANMRLTHKGCNSRKNDSCEGCFTCDMTKIGWDNE